MLQGDKFSPPELDIREAKRTKPLYLGTRNQATPQAVGRVKRSTFTFRNDLAPDVLEKISISDDDDLKDISSCESEDEYLPTESTDDSDGSSDGEGVARKKKLSKVAVESKVVSGADITPVEFARQERLRKQREKQAKFQQEVNTRKLIPVEDQGIDIGGEEMWENLGQMPAMNMMMSPEASGAKSGSPKRRKCSSVPFTDKCGLDNSHEKSPNSALTSAEPQAHSLDQLVSTSSVLCVSSPEPPVAPQTLPNYHPMHQMLQLALKSQREQAEAMHLQSLQAQSQFFLKLQAQLVAQASPGHQVEAVQASQSQVTFTQRVETTYSKSPEKSYQVLLKKILPLIILHCFSF